MNKKIINNTLLACVGILLSFQNPSFKETQLRHTRVKNAYQSKWSGIKEQLQQKQISPGQLELFLRIFKKEGQLEAWVKNKSDKAFVLFNTYPICAKSGELGPKRRQGDFQVPEGFYEIAGFQPQSAYHLALRVNYPNKSDKIRSKGLDPGGDIMIHGNCVTIGCIPIQNEPIEELYILAAEARNNGSNISTHIFPLRFKQVDTHRGLNSTSETQQFWENLKPGYEFFENKQQLPDISVNKSGEYVLNSNSQ